MGYALCRQPLTIAHCFKIQDSWHICKWVLDFCCPNLAFGMLGASSLASWETLGRSWAIGEHRKGHVGAWSGFVFIFFVNLRIYCKRFAQSAGPGLNTI